MPSFGGGSLQILTSAVFADNPCAATKSKTSEDIAQSSKYSPAYSPDPYYHSESEYWSFQGSPKGNKSPFGAGRKGNTFLPPNFLGGNATLSWVWAHKSGAGLSYLPR